MSASRQPRRLNAALRRVHEQTTPQTLLAAVQAAWPDAAGATIAAEAAPVSERNGVVTVACHSATWAQELDLLQDELRGRLETAMGGPEAERLASLRFTADEARHRS